MKLGSQSKVIDGLLGEMRGLGLEGAQIEAVIDSTGLTMPISDVMVGLR